MDDLLRVYYNQAEISPDTGYPFAWTGRWPNGTRAAAIKDLIRERDGHRCLRCKHPYESGGQWSRCDEGCEHGGPVRVWNEHRQGWEQFAASRSRAVGTLRREAEWKILTVHHLNNAKHDCRWWNLVSLCQRCHLTIQAKVYMDCPYPMEHSHWFRPFAAGFYAMKYLGEELTQEETLRRIDELLSLEQTHDPLF